MRQRAGHDSRRASRYGATCDAHHPTAPHEKDAVPRPPCAGALAGAGAERPRVDTSCTRNGHAAQRLRGDEGVFARSAETVPVSSSKSYFVHTLGASGGIEAVISVLALRNQLAPPTLRLDVPRPIARSTAAPHAPADDDDEHSVEYVRLRAARRLTAFPQDVRYNARFLLFESGLPLQHPAYRCAGSGGIDHSAPCLTRRPPPDADRPFRYRGPLRAPPRPSCATSRHATTPGHKMRRMNTLSATPSLRASGHR